MGYTDDSSLAVPRRTRRRTELETVIGSRLLAKMSYGGYNSCESQYTLCRLSSSFTDKVRGGRGFEAVEGFDRRVMRPKARLSRVGPKTTKMSVIGVLYASSGANSDIAACSSRFLASILSV